MSNLRKGPVVETLHDGSLVLSFNHLYPDKDVMESDLVFAAGAFVANDPMLKTQREIMEEIAWRWYAVDQIYAGNPNKNPEENT